jgi:hypothetical protein
VRGCREQLFVRGKPVRLFTVFVSSIEARLWLLIDAVPHFSERHKTVSTERAQHIKIPLPRAKDPLRFGSTRATALIRYPALEISL